MRLPGSSLRLGFFSWVLAMIGILLGMSNTSADLSFSGYIWNCTSTYCALKDPVNILFDINGTLGNSLDHVYHHLGWTDQGGGNMNFIDHAVQENTEAQRASHCLACSRYHQRYNQGNDSGGPAWGTWTMGPVHYEVITWRGHASTTFDGARNYVWNIFSYSHNWGWYWKANTQASQQCDGSWVAGDGYINWLDI